MKTRKRYVSMLLVLCMIGGMVTISESNAFADSGKQAIMSGVSSMGNPQTDCIYFGTYLQSNDGTVLGYVDEPIKWRMLSEENGKMFLVSDHILDMKQYYTSETEITWENSTLRNWMNGTTEGNFYADAFDLLEQRAIAETELVNADNFEYGIEGGNNTVDKVFALSIDEVNQYFPDNASRVATNTAYAARRGDGVKAAGEADMYYLRSPGCLTSRAAVVTARGKVNVEGRGLEVFTIGARPAFHMDLNSVLFTSAAVGGKTVDGMEGALSTINTDYSGNEWKATVLDPSRGAFTASVLSTNDSIWTIRYDGAKIGANEYLSVMTADERGVYTHYGRIEKLAKESQESGTVEIDFSEIDMAGKTVYVFNEQYNGGANDDTKLTDYASQFVSIMPFRKITWSDFQKDDKPVANQAFLKDAFVGDCYAANLNATVCNFAGAAINKLNMVDFEAKITYIGSGDFICYGGTDSATGLKIGVTENEELSVAPLGLVFEPEVAEVTSFLNREITLRITTEYGDYDADGSIDDAKFGFYIDGTLYNSEYCYAYNTQLIANCMAVHAVDKGILIRSVSDTKEILHNLSNGDYINLTNDFADAYRIGEHLASDINSSGLGTSGDFEVCDVNDVQIGELVLFDEKDVHPDGKTDVRDLVAMKKVKCGVSLTTWSGTMAAYTADFDETVIIDALLHSMQ